VKIKLDVILCIREEEKEDWGVVWKSRRWKRRVVCWRGRRQRDEKKIQFKKNKNVINKIL